MWTQLGVAALALGVMCGPASAAATSPPAGERTMLPREAGARHGQAMGVVLLCYGLKTTPALDRLPEKYTGPDRAAFDDESRKVIAAWQDAGSCQQQRDPNICRLTYEWSCSAAVREIGPDGTVLPGLVEPKTEAAAPGNKTQP